MKVEQVLFKHYDEVVDSPEAVSKLRKFILDLAVRGRLVEQDFNDEPASELLVRIVAIREKLSKSGSIKKITTLPHIESSPYDVPTNWQWTRIREVTSDRGQIVPETEFTYIDVSAIDKAEGVVVKPKVVLPENAPSRARKLAKKNDVIYSCVRPYLLNVAIIDRDFDPKPIVSTAFVVLNGYNLVSSRYLWIALRSPFMIECVESNQRGQAYPAINDSDFAKLPFPLPPLAEQHRIVAKVEELMTRCNRLEDKFKERETHRKRFTKASFASLTESGIDEGEFKKRGRFFVKNFVRLAVDVGQIKNLRQLILDLAVQGRLVEQDPKDEPAEQLLARIRKERQEFIGSGMLKNLKIYSDNLMEPLPMLPSSWKWVAIGDIFLYDAGKKRNPETLDTNNWLLELEDIEKNSGRLLKRVRVREREAKSTKSEFQTNDILYGKLRPYLNKVLVADQCGYSTTEIVSIRPYLPICSKYCALALRRSDFVKYVTRLGQGTKMPRLRTEDAKVAAFPLPPIAEQQRIVSKVDELIGECEKLERNLHKTVSVRNLSLESCISEFQH